MEIIDSFNQQDPEWFKARISSIGGSSIGTVASIGNGRKSLLYKFAGEILSGQKSEGYSGWQMDRGNKYEPEARKFYEMTNKVKVDQVALIKEDDHRHISPDGLVRENGFIEIKIAIPSVFVEFIDNPVLPTGDRRQCQWGFKIMKRKWCDYIKYCPEIAESGSMSPMIVKRLYPDHKEINELSEAANKFITEMLMLVKNIKKQ